MQITTAAFFEMPILPPLIDVEFDKDQAFVRRLVSRKSGKAGKAPRLAEGKYKSQLKSWGWVILVCHRARWSDGYVMAKIYRPCIRIRAETFPC